MLDPHTLYELAVDLPILHRPVLIQALTGFVDAGNVSRIIRDHLTLDNAGRRVATFDLDQLLDYRTRRPAMIFHQGRLEHYETPRLTVTALSDASETPFLLLTGPEPDLQWERFIAAVLALIEKLGVSLTVGVNSIPMAVPHTRPTEVTAHATRPDLIAGYEPWPQRIHIPAGVGTLLEYRLGQCGKDALGFAAHVPHYLSQSEYPAAAERIVQSIVASAGLNLPTDDLHAAALTTRLEIDRQVAQAEEAIALVTALEQQYDAQEHHTDTDRERQPEAKRTTPLPTADELAAELEQYLAEQPHPDDPSN